MSQTTETLWQIGQPGKGGQEFSQEGGWHSEFTYIIGSDPDPINQPTLPSLLVAPGRKTKPKHKGKELFATNKLNIQFTLTQSYKPGELTLVYNFFGSEVDTLWVDGAPVTELVGSGSSKYTQTQTPLPALGSGQHTLTLTTATGLGDGAHRIDYLKLEAVIFAHKSPPFPAPNTKEGLTAKPQLIKETAETMAKKQTPPPAETPPSEEKKSYVPTSQTGLQDYSYWWEYARKTAKAPDKQSKSYRRGRIWA